jgi:hypothetical protein
MIKTSKPQTGKPSTRLNPSNSDYWPSQDDPHDAWPIEFLETAAKTRPPSSKIRGLPEAASERIVRPAQKPQLKKKVRRKAA